MPSTQTWVPKSSDRALVILFKDLCSILGTPHFRISTLGGTGTIALEAKNVDPDDYISDGFSDIIKIQVDKDMFTVTLDRINNATSDSLLYDNLTINNNAQDNGRPDLVISTEKYAEVRTRIAEALGRDDESVPALFKNPKLFRDVLASHHKQNAQLQQMVVDVGKEAAKARIDLDKEYSRRCDALEEEAEKAKQAADAKIAEQLAELSAERERLAAQQKVLDDRSNTHARRELHKDLKAKIAQRGDSFKVTPETKANRTPIHVIVVAVLACLFGLVVFFTVEFSKLPVGASSLQIAIAGVKPAITTIAMLGIVAWYLRWMNRWFERYADTEFQLKQFELDIDRASWVVEAALEWKLSQDRPMPEHLLETISRNLFSKSEKDESADMHPADYLASAILGRASSVNLKVPGGEISLNGKDIQRLQND